MKPLRYMHTTGVEEYIPCYYMDDEGNIYSNNIRAYNILRRHGLTPEDAEYLHSLNDTISSVKDLWKESYSHINYYVFLSIVRGYHSYFKYDKYKPITNAYTYYGEGGCPTLRIQITTPDCDKRRRKSFVVARLVYHTLKGFTDKNYNCCVNLKDGDHTNIHPSNLYIKYKNRKIRREIRPKTFYDDYVFHVPEITEE